MSDSRPQTCQEWQTKYPDAITPRVQSVPLNSYCVGGALCREAFPGINHNFPWPGLISQAITKLGGKDQDTGSKITAANDAGNIAEAWAIACEALGL